MWAFPIAACVAEQTIRNQARADADRACIAAGGTPAPREDEYERARRTARTESRREESALYDVYPSLGLAVLAGACLGSRSDDSSSSSGSSYSGGGGSFDGGGSSGDW